MSRNLGFHPAFYLSVAMEILNRAGLVHANIMAQDNYSN